MYKTYRTRNYQYTKDTVETIRQYADDLGNPAYFLQTPYNKVIGIFPYRTFNLARQLASIPHTDNNNLVQGWCSIIPSGDFDPVKAGYLVLWDLGLVVEFPPSSTILIPSSMVVHSNTPI